MEQEEEEETRALVTDSSPLKSALDEWAEEEPGISVAKNDEKHAASFVSVADGVLTTESGESVCAFGGIGS